MLHGTDALYLRQVTIEVGSAAQQLVKLEDERVCQSFALRTSLYVANSTSRQPT